MNQCLACKYRCYINPATMAGADWTVGKSVIYRIKFTPPKKKLTRKNLKKKKRKKRKFIGKDQNT